MSIDLSKRIYKVLTDENSVVEKKIINLIEDKEKYILIEYDSLGTETISDKPYKSLALGIASILDHKTIPPLYKKILLGIGVFVILALSVLVPVCSLTGTGIHKIDELIKDLTTTSIIIIVFSSLIVFVTLIMNSREVLSNIAVFRKFLIPKKVDQLMKSDQNSVTDTANTVSKWFRKDKKYVLILHSMQWELDNSTDIYDFIVLLLKQNKQLKLIYSLDNEHVLLEPDDALSVKLSMADLPYQKIKIEYVTKAELQHKVEAYSDDAFLNLFIEKLKKLSPTNYEIEVLYYALDNIYDRFGKEGKFELKDYLADLPQRSKVKMGLIIKYLERETNFLKNHCFYKENLFFALLYHTYFYRKPIDKTLAQKMLLAIESVSLSEKLKMTPGMVIKNIHEMHSDITGYWNDYIQDALFAGISDYTIFKIGDRTIEFAAEQWIVNYLVTNILNKNFKSDAIGIKSKNYSKPETFIRLMLFYGKDFSSLDQETANRLLSRFEAIDQFVFGLHLSTQLAEIPFKDDQMGNYFLLSSSLANGAWQHYLQNLQEEKTDIPAILLLYQINPYNVLLQLTYCVLGKIKNIDIDLENIVRIASEPAITGFEQEHALFKSKFDKLIARHRFYLAEYESEQQNIPYLNLMKEVEDRLIILLPLIDFAYTKEDFLVLDIQKYADIPTENFDFIFLQILVGIHNNFYNSGDGYVKRERYDKKEIDAIKRKIKEYTGLLDRKNPDTLNFKDYCYRCLYEAKFYMVLHLCKNCGITITSEHYDKKTHYNTDKFQKALLLFNFIDDYLGIIDTLYWESWFDTRLIMEDKEINMKGTAHRIAIDENIRDMHRYAEHLGYLHFDSGLIYLSIISDMVIEPPVAYEKIKNLLNNKKNIPKFIRFQLINKLALICYNGSFKESLREECKTLTKEILSDYQEFMEKEGFYDKKSLIFSCLLATGSNIEEMKNLAEEIDANLDSMSAWTKGLYYKDSLRYAYENKETYTKYCVSGKLQFLKENLKHEPFYYIQFLRSYIDFYHNYVLLYEIEDILQESKQLIEEAVKLEAEMLEAGETVAAISEINTKYEKVQINNERLTQIDEDRKYDSSNTKEARIKELEEELRKFSETIALQVLNDNTPNQYLIVSTSKAIGNFYHSKHGINHPKTIEYYEVCIENYFDLGEYVKFMEVALDMKVLFKSQKNTAKLQALNEKVDFIIHVSGIATTIQAANADDEIEQLAKLVYDFLNPSWLDHNTDYHTLTGIHKKMEIASWKIGSDDKGLRKLFFNFKKTDGSSEGQMIKVLGEIVSYAEANIDKLTFDDVRTIEHFFEEVDNSLTSIELHENKMELDKRLSSLAANLKMQVISFFSYREKTVDAATEKEAI